MVNGVILRQIIFLLTFEDKYKFKGKTVMIINKIMIKIKYILLFYFIISS